MSRKFPILCLLFLAAPGWAADEPPVTPDYKSINENILQKTCFRCHGQNGVVNGGANYTDYDTLIASNVVKPEKPEESELFIQVNSGRMPRGGPKLSDAYIQAIKDWITAGAKNDEAPPTS